MTSIQAAIASIKSELPEGVRLIAVSKTHPSTYIEEAYKVGQLDFGENKVQEMTDKADTLPTDIRWHMIGHLQTNKVKYMARYVYMIHSIDSSKLLETVNKEAQKVSRTIKCLLQVHVAKEDTKFGFSPDALKSFLDDGSFRRLSNVSICGLMAMATNTEDESEVECEFELAHKLFMDIKEQYFAECPEFKELSMGMSGDYPLAMKHGSTYVRIGSKIFGERDYSKVGK